MDDPDTEWYVSCKAFTCWVKTVGQHGSKIIDAALIMKRFIGQNFNRICCQLGIDTVIKL